MEQLNSFFHWLGGTTRVESTTSNLACLPNDVMWDIMGCLDDRSYQALCVASKAAYKIGNGQRVTYHAINFADFSWWNRNLSNTVDKLNQLQCNTLRLTSGPVASDNLSNFKEITTAIKDNPKIQEVHLAMLLASSNVDHRSVTMVAAVLQITHLYLAYSFLETTGIGVIATMPNLVYLDLNHTDIMSDHLHQFEQLSKLRTLHIDTNRISNTTPSDLNNFTQLTELSARKVDCAYTGPTSSAPNLTNLRTLRLGGNNLTDLSAITGMSDLTELDISYGNTGVDLAPLANATHLTALDVSYSNKKTNATVISGLTNLTNLHMTDSKDIGGNIGSFTTLNKLKTLKISGALPRHVPTLTMLTCFTNLVELDISSCRVSYEVISRLTTLTVLNISNNDLGLTSTLQATLACLTKLSKLDLGYNKGALSGDPYERATSGIVKKWCFTDLFLILVALPNLTDLACPGIFSDPPKTKSITHFTRLTSLDMSDNHLKPGSAKHIANLPNLTALNLSNNALGHDGMRHLLKLKKLESVQLKDNELKTDYVADRYHAEEYRKQLLRK